MAEAEQEAWREEVFSLITLATDSFPETGRARRGKRCNKERMNGRMKEREGGLLGTGWCQSIISSVLLDEGSNEGMETQKAAAALPSGSKAQVPRAGTAIQASKAQTEHTPPTHTHPHPRPAGAHSSWGRRAEPPPEAWFETPQQTALPPLRKRFIPTGSVLHKSSTRTGCKNVRS